MTIQEAIHLAVQRHEAGDLRAAEALYRQVLAINPNHSQALNLLGVLASQAGRHDVGAELIGKAISLDPAQADYHGNLGLVLAEMKRPDEAIESYRRAIALNPRFAQAHSNLGSALSDLGRTDEAIQCFGAAIACQPDHAQAWYNMANVQKSIGSLEEAVAAYRRALASRPQWREAQNNLGNALCALGRHDEAEALYRKSLAERPGDALAHWNVGLLLLRRGDLERGWPEYEWRWQVPELNLHPLNLPQPRWDGTDLNGKRIFLHAEQGWGDTIQFIRYVPLVAAKGGQVVIGCQPELLALLRGFDGAQEWITTGDQPPACDVYCPLPSLPGALGTSLATIPATTPYLSADPTRKSHWRDRLAGLPGRKVGLCWAGRPTHPHDRDRSLPLERLRPLALPGVCLISLQKGDAARQTRAAGFPVTDWTQELYDFADTAALIDCLDLVVTVDTAVAHLAGALGKGVWLLLHAFCDWRWMCDRADSPWYPTMRLFRQDRLGDWNPPISRAVQALRE